MFGGRVQQVNYESLVDLLVRNGVDGNVKHTILAGGFWDDGDCVR